MNFCPIFDHSTTKNIHSLFRSSTRDLRFRSTSRSLSLPFLQFYSYGTVAFFLPSSSL